MGEEVSGSLTAIQGFYRASQIAGIGDYAEVVHGKYWGSPTIVSYKYYKITLWILGVCLFE